MTFISIHQHFKGIDVAAQNIMDNRPVTGIAEKIVHSGITLISSLCIRFEKSQTR